MTESFKECFGEGVLSSTTSKVLEMMHSQFLIAHSGKCNATMIGGMCNITYKCGNPLKAYCAHIVIPNERGFFCQWIIFSGYNCRHIFAVVEHFNFTQKVALKTVNSQFYLNQDIVNIREVNAEAMKMIESIISMKKHCYGSILPENHQKVFFSYSSSDSEVSKANIIWMGSNILPGCRVRCNRVGIKKKSSRQPKTIIVTPTFKRGEKRDRHSLLSEHSTLGECEIPEEKTA